MGSIDIGICHDNQFLIASFANIELSAKSCSHSCEKTANLLISKDFIHSCLFNVKDFTTNW
ncbi:Uncharacterised protein [Mycobacteroides abscessus subsp. abscessus]|nr:Uncharacterised protein [Mycobacteroides abscessus subsp. abscessus]